MIDDRTILVDLDGAVATLTLHRPKSLNALTPDLLIELGSALERLGGDDSVRVLVLTGAGRSFSAGVDLKALEGRSLSGGSVGDILDLPARRVLELLTTIPKPVVAKVNGFCFTGALELALACDLIVTADEAKWGDTHAKFGLRPTWGMSQRLLRTVGPARARELSYTARIFFGSEAAAWGIAIRSVPLVQLDAAVDEVVGQLLSNSSGSLAAYKDLYRAALDFGLRDGLAYEGATAYAITDTHERVAFF